NDGSTEGLEDFLVRLTNPGGGATLARENVASVYVSDPAAVSEVGFFSDSVEVAEDGFGTAVIVLRRGGSAVEAVSVDFAAGGGNAIAQTDFDGPTVGTVSWAAGDGRPKNLLFDIIDDDSSESTESFEIRLSNAVGTVISGPPTATVRIADAGGSDADPTPAPDTGRSGGGSSFALLVLLCLRLLPAVLRAYRRDAA
ncbi:MAG: Calx-beta domain-containing protein, partial [Woeseia sp.]